MTEHKTVMAELGGTELGDGAADGALDGERPGRVHERYPAPRAPAPPAVRRSRPAARPGLARARLKVCTGRVLYVNKFAIPI